MATTGRLMMRVHGLKDEVERRILQNGGEASGTISEIKGNLGIYCPNNVLRLALETLFKEGRLRRTEPDMASKLRRVMNQVYRYVSPLYPEQRLREQLAQGRIAECGSATKYLDQLGLRGFITPDEFDEIILRMKFDDEIKAPMADHASESRPLSENVYLFLELKTEEPALAH